MTIFFNLNSHLFQSIWQDALYVLAKKYSEVHITRYLFFYCNLLSSTKSRQVAMHLIP